MTFRISTLVKSSVVLAALLLASGASAQAPGETKKDANVTAGRAEGYKLLQAGSLEAVSNRKAITNLDAVNMAPTRIWTTLEHGEKLECLACVPVVSKLLYNTHPKTREIAAWWLRRRIFGVFGPGQVYAQTIGTLGNANETESHRVYAANALGEFLSLSGVPALSKAVSGDASAAVRAAAVSALERLNSPGAKGTLQKAFSDGDADVRLAALHAATHINTFTDAESVVAMISDASPLVRRRAAETLGVMRAADAVMGLIELTSPKQESEGPVRAAAVWALGQIGDPAGADAILAAKKDADNSVQSAAKVAARRMGI